MDMGLPVAFGSDAPVISFNVMEGIYCAVTRKDLKGFPESGWLPDQKMSVYDAVYAYTMGGAYASYDEGKKAASGTENMPTSQCWIRMFSLSPKKK